MKPVHPFFGRRTVVVLALLLAGLGAARAQWVTENYPLKAGWNAIWLSHDCGYDEIDALLAAQTEVQQIWRWNPNGSTIQYITTPANPVQPDAEWAVWRRGSPTGSTLFRLTANAAYLVNALHDTTLTLTGRPALPRFNGQTTGLSFTGFPMDPAGSDIQRRFDRFLSFDPVLKNTLKIFNYVGGAFSDTAPKNPVQITQFTQTPVNRNVAYWVAAPSYTAYYGPVSIIPSADDLEFGTGGVARSLRVKNVTDPAKNLAVTVTLTLAPSATAPAGQAAVAGAVPLLTRGELDAGTLQYPYTPVTTITLGPLAPGEEREVEFYLDRTAMGNVAGKVFQSVIQVTDSLKMTRIDVPVSATSSSLAGLWVGDAVVSQVDQIQGTASTLAQASGGEFAQRLVVHINAAGQATILQQAYVATVQNGVPRVYSKAGYDAIAANAESPARVSSAFFPLDLVAAGSGTVGGTVAFDFPLDYQASTNPFVHTYNPAHDNLNARFDPAPIAAGLESFTVRRTISLAFLGSGAGITDPAWGSTMLGGNYSEQITGLRSKPINVAGAFVLRRVSTAAILVTP